MFYKTTFSGLSHVSLRGRAEQMQQDERNLYVLIVQVNSVQVNLKNIQYVAMPAGIIRGTLIRLGLHGTVTPETNAPQCTSHTVFGRIVH